MTTDTVSALRQRMIEDMNSRGEVLNLLGIWRGASFACDSANGLGEPSKGAPHGDETTCFAAHA